MKVTNIIRKAAIRDQLTVVGRGRGWGCWVVAESFE